MLPGRNANKFPCLFCALISLQVQESWLLDSGCVLTRGPRACFKWKTPLPHSLPVKIHPLFKITFCFQHSEIPQHQRGIMTPCPTQPQLQPCLGCHGNRSHPKNVPTFECWHVIWERQTSQRVGKCCVCIQYCAKALHTKYFKYKYSYRGVGFYFGFVFCCFFKYGFPLRVGTKTS